MNHYASRPMMLEWEHQNVQILNIPDTKQYIVKSMFSEVTFTRIEDAKRFAQELISGIHQK